MPKPERLAIEPTEDSSADALSPSESHRLKQLEKVIAQFRESYYAAGDALREHSRPGQRCRLARLEVMRRPSGIDPFELLRFSQAFHGLVL